MILEQALHERWAASSALSALLPAENVRTGLFRDARPPYAVLVRRASRPLCRTNTGEELEEVTLAIHVWHDDHDAGQQIAREVKAAFDRSAFDLADGARVLQMRWAGDRIEQHPDGAWQFTLEFVVQTFSPSGA
jgi:Protein of unknown function (DUF3168)